MRVSIAGTGYVGLVSGLCLAELGHQVICIDLDEEKVKQINRGVAPIYEEGLPELLAANIGNRLQASTDLQKSVLDTDITLIAVGTPFNGEEIDLSFIKNVSAEIGKSLALKTHYHVVVVKSTVVPGTTDEVVLPILESSSGRVAGDDFGVGMNPEFLKEGEAIQDFMNPDRIVLGGIDMRTIEQLKELYGVFSNTDILEVNCRTAEMIKYTANSLLATLISFSNEIGNLCAATGQVDVTDVMAGVHLDKRLSPILDTGERITPAITSYIEAGCGFGGSCFPKDVKALVAYGRAMGHSMSLLQSVIQINGQQPVKLLEIFDVNFKSGQGIKAAVLGLSFKPGSDDMRESPAVPIIRGLADRCAEITVYDPIAKAEAQKLFNDITLNYADDLESAIQNVDVIFIVTRWSQFENLPQIISKLGKKFLLIDGRRMIDPGAVENYCGIGM